MITRCNKNRYKKGGGGVSAEYARLRKNFSDSALMLLGMASAGYNDIHTLPIKVFVVGKTMLRHINYPGSWDLWEQ